MNSTPPNSDETFGTSWLTKVKIGLTGLAFAAAGLFGAAAVSTADAPEPPAPDETAGATWGYSIDVEVEDGNGGKWGGGARLFGATWG